jgi:hypothetical protein
MVVFVPIINNLLCTTVTRQTMNRILQGKMAFMPTVLLTGIYRLLAVNT